MFENDKIWVHGVKGVHEVQGCTVQGCTVQGYMG